MLILDNNQVKYILCSELGYSPIEADSYLRDFPVIHDELADAVQRWLEDRTVLETNIFGLSIKDYMRTHHSHFLMAVRDLNHLYDNDLTPERRDRLVGILRKPNIRW